MQIHATCFHHCFKAKTVQHPTQVVADSLQEWQYLWSVSDRGVELKRLAHLSQVHIEEHRLFAGGDLDPVAASSDPAYSC